MLSVCLVALVGLLGGSAYRLTQGPVALPAWLVTQVEVRANRALADLDLSLGGLGLAYDLEDHGLRFIVSDARLSRAGEHVVRLPSLTATLDGAQLAMGHIRPRSLRLDGLALDLARNADGQFNLTLGAGGGGALPRDAAEVLAALDMFLAAPLVADLRSIRASGIALGVRDVITGLSQDVTDGDLTVLRSEAGLEMTMRVRLPVGAARPARLAITLARDGVGQGAKGTLALVDVPLAYMGEAAPGIPALSLAEGMVSASATVTVSEQGVPGPVLGRVALQDLRSVDRPALALDRVSLDYGWTPGSGRVALTDLTASAEDLSLQASGQVLFPQGLTGPIQGQLRLGETILNPDDMFETRVAFDDGVIEAQITQAPLALHLGQAMVTGPSGTARLSGRLRFLPDGPEGSLALAVPEMAVPQLKALWPPSLQVQARRWFVNNMIGGTAQDVTGAVRLSPGQPPDVLASFSYTGGNLRFMRFMPPAEAARGAAHFDGRRLAMRVDSALVPAIGPGETATPETPRLPLRDTTFVIEDATQRPPVGALKMRASGDLGDVLTLLNNRPLRILDRLKRDRDYLSGRGDALVEVRLPLRQGNAPADIDWSVAATLRDVRSNQIVPNRVIEAESLAFLVTPAAVEIEGQLTFDGIPFDGGWRQALPPRGTEAIDPDAPPPPPVPLPEPGRVNGLARVSPADLERLGIEFGALDLSGRTTAQVSVTVPQGQAPSLSIASDLRGLEMSLPALSWSKPAAAGASFAMEARLGAAPEVTRLDLEASGLTARGRVTLRDGGGLDTAAFDVVDLGWFRGPVTLTGQGRGAAPTLTVRGGQADFRRATLRGGRGSGASGGGSPMRLALDRLILTDGIALTGVRAQLQSGTGTFTGQINGGSAIEGVLVRQGAGTAVQVQSQDAGEVLRSAGLFQDARGGTVQLTLQPTGQQGIYDGALRIAGIRIRNAPALASLLQSLSVVGLLEQLQGDGLSFTSVESDFTLRPGDIVVRRASAVGPSMSITADGVYDLGSKAVDMQGVVSPIYVVNGLFGALFAREDEGLFGFTYQINGLVNNPNVTVNPLSILTPGIFREIFRRPPPEG
ncbi:hypothetical protein JANAI62_29030 [Jannaschia pagri]|uniref:AsmA-like C-terminal region n=2 Tax=Roseobacteraceae TaxID=2854170 RepID=A0ABQ4NPF6_9RHOB|nr:hypothetical protein JANAI61_29030 [Jannaschia sp. AI_61]GIT96280.1 hypothetical protein JANAI62_29030 [Jannaschia sp. AI_62]